MPQLISSMGRIEEGSGSKVIYFWGK
jgi:hypothetical protein